MRAKLRSFRDEYGAAVNIPANAVAYEITNCGDDVRGKPETWSQLEQSVIKILADYHDITWQGKPEYVKQQLKVWLAVNEGKS